MTLLEQLLDEYEIARSYSEQLVAGLSNDEIAWRPHVDSSGIGWHLGHQAAVNHFMVRNLTAAEPSHNKQFDSLFDSATLEPDRGDLPPVDQILAYRAAVAASTKSTIERVDSGDVGSPTQLRSVAEGLLRAVINHEYQHDTWVLEVRNEIGMGLVPDKPTVNAEDVDGYWLLTI